RSSSTEPHTSVSQYLSDRPCLVRGIPSATASLDPFLFPVHYLDLREEIRQGRGFLGHDLPVFSKGSLFQCLSNPTDLVKSVSAPVSFHAMPQEAHGFHVVSLDRGDQSGRIVSPIVQEPGNDLFQIRIDIDCDFCWAVAVEWRNHFRLYPSQALSTSINVSRLIGLVMCALHPASSIFSPSSFRARAVSAMMWVWGRSCSCSHARICFVDS